MLLGILLVGVSVFILNQKLTYQSSAKEVNLKSPKNKLLNPLSQSQLKKLNQYGKVSQTKNYNKGVVNLGDGGFCTRDYCYTKDGQRIKREDYAENLYNEIFPEPTEEPTEEPTPIGPNNWE